MIHRKRECQAQVLDEAAGQRFQTLSERKWRGIGVKPNLMLNMKESIVRYTLILTCYPSLTHLLHYIWPIFNDVSLTAFSTSLMKSSSDFTQLPTIYNSWPSVQ